MEKGKNKKWREKGNKVEGKGSWSLSRMSWKEIYKKMEKGKNKKWREKDKKVEGKRSCTYF